MKIGKIKKENFLFARKKAHVNLFFLSALLKFPNNIKWLIYPEVVFVLAVMLAGGAGKPLKFPFWPLHVLCDATGWIFKAI